MKKQNGHTNWAFLKAVLTGEKYERERKLSPEQEEVNINIIVRESQRDLAAGVIEFSQLLSAQYEQSQENKMIREIRQRLQAVTEESFDKEATLGRLDEIHQEHLARREAAKKK